MKTKILIVLLSLVLLGFVIPEPVSVPVSGATSHDWNQDTFWYEPWGKSGVHKGIDIFADAGTTVVATTNQMIIYRGQFSRGGKVVIALGPKWRIHYYAHLQTISEQGAIFVSQNSVIGTVGTSGNAKGKPAHLHYSLMSLMPLPWLIDTSAQGYKKAFYLNPIEYFDAP